MIQKNIKKQTSKFVNTLEDQLEYKNNKKFRIKYVGSKHSFTHYNQPTKTSQTTLFHS